MSKLAGEIRSRDYFRKHFSLGCEFYFTENGFKVKNSEFPSIEIASYQPKGSKAREAFQKGYNTQCKHDREKIRI